ncbi:hypothetical protein EYF80_000541 [Liparis tanakae]|uniref:Uncharacterized protein n=1 Tax=Liparis tanakae TaxID=230148 RepID=A0A4Z2JHG7_9TELE|nr:hypothetical protein EYF80_000541 [Liparis tanakae]
MLSGVTGSTGFVSSASSSSDLQVSGSLLMTGEGQKRKMMRELQRRLNIGHIDDHTGAELRLVLVLVLGDSRRRV